MTNIKLLTSNTLLTFVSVLVIISAPGQAHAISQYISEASITMTIENGPALEIIQVIGVQELDESSGSDTGFPSFYFNETSANYDSAMRRLTVNTRANGAAVYTGGDIEQAIANSTARMRATLELFNESEFGLYIDIRVQGSFTYSLLPSHPSEYAGIVGRVDFSGSPFVGLPPEGYILDETLRLNTSDPAPYSTEMNVDETYSVRIPPSLIVDGSVVNITTYHLGILVQSGGSAASRYDGDSPLVLLEIPEAPVVITPKEFLHVGIDVKPRCIKINGRGKIPVRILGSEEFDVTQINRSSLEFAGGHVAHNRSHYKQNKHQCVVKDVAGDVTWHGKAIPDGWPDLVCNFFKNAKKWSLVNGNAAILRGELMDGTQFSGGKLIPTNNCRSW